MRGFLFSLIVVVCAAWTDMSAAERARDDFLLAQNREISAEEAARRAKEKYGGKVLSSRLVDPGDARSIEVRSATGYARRFPTRDLDRLWLVTHVDGEPLTAGHGFPARIVAPDRRGFWWVKWVVRIQTSNVPWKGLIL